MCCGGTALLRKNWMVSVGGTEKSLLRLVDLVSAVGGEVIGTEQSIHNFSFYSVATDSRNVTSGSLFVPLVGEFQDGHHYIPAALEKGASAVFADFKHRDFIQQTVEAVAADKNAVIILVENTLYALQHAAAAYVAQFRNLIKIGVTGSNGKTTTKELLKSVISQKYRVVATEGNYNSETGLPLSVFKINSEHEVGIFEMGMNRVDEIGELSRVLCPQYAIITNIGTAHVGILGSQDNIAAEKKKIFSQFTQDGRGFVPENDTYVTYLKQVPQGSVQSFGKTTTPGVSNIENLGLAGTRFVLSGVPVTLPLAGEYNFSNALGVVSLALELGISPEQIKTGLESIQPMTGRSNILKGRFTVVEDCYNANAESMGESIKFYGSISMPQNAKKVLVLGDMFELGDQSAEIHERMVSLAWNSGAQVLILLGESFCDAAEVVLCKMPASEDSPVVLLERSSDDKEISGIAARLCKMMSDGDLVLIKGSRGMHLERIATPLISSAEKGAV